MKQVNTEGQIPIKMWLDDMEPGALAQAKNLANLPFAFKHIAIMPDSHQGYGMPIGGVLCTRDYVVPNAVGVDIGCGMMALNTYIEADSISKEALINIMTSIRQDVPVGFNSHQRARANVLPWAQQSLLIHSLKQKAERQLGTLGGGNHFIELQRDEAGYLWIMIHSGSRGLGYKVAAHHNKIAEQLNEQWFSVIDKKQGLAFLPFGSEEGKAYWHDMQFCVEYASENREEMMFIVADTISLLRGVNIDTQNSVHLSHNFAALENHFGENVIVHRKGATRARAGEYGIIPGSQGTCSYIVRGLGNPESFHSCSHGAGRRMGRNQARRELNLENELAGMQGIMHSVRNEKDLDEAPGAYKDIDEVMRNQQDLVDIEAKLTPIAVVKG